MPADQFIEVSKKALNPETQYYSLLKKFTVNKTDPELLKKLMTAAGKAYDDATPYFEAYAKTQNSMFTKENIEYIKMFASTTTDTGFQMILNNQNRFDDAEGAGKANEFLVTVIVNDYLRKLYRKKESGKLEMDEEVMTMVRSKFPRQANQVFALAKVNKLSSIPDWKNYEIALMDYMKEFGAITNSSEQLNEFAWNIFLHGENDESVKQAQAWSKKSLSGKDIDNPMYMEIGRAHV